VQAAIAPDDEKKVEVTRAPEPKPAAPTPEAALRACLDKDTTEIHLLVKGTTYTVKSGKLSAAATKCVQAALVKLGLDKTKSIEVDVK
jgi:hypothetical protein